MSEKKIKTIDLSVYSTNDHWTEEYLNVFAEQQKPHTTYTGRVISIKEWPEYNQIQITYALSDYPVGIGRDRPPFPAFQLHREHSPKEFRDIQLKVGDHIEVKTGENVKITSIKILGNNLH